MPNVLVGQRVYVPVNAGTNGGVDFAVGHITEVVVPEDAVCNIRVTYNRALTVDDLDDLMTNVEVKDYEGDARALGVGMGAWLPDWA